MVIPSDIAIEVIAQANPDRNKFESMPLLLQPVLLQPVLLQPDREDATGERPRFKCGIMKLCGLIIRGVEGRG
jgi:hypothetical protein